MSVGYNSLKSGATIIGVSSPVMDILCRSFKVQIDNTFSFGSDDIREGERESCRSANMYTLCVKGRLN